MTAAAAFGNGLPRRVLWVLAVLTALSPLSMDIFTPSLPAIQADLGASDAMAQASITACLIGIGVGQLVLGPVSERVGRRPVILVGLIGWTLSSALSAIVTGPAQLVLARGLAGVAGAACIVAARSVVRDLASSSHAVAAAIGGLAIATALAPIVSPIFGWGIAAVWDWRADFWALAIIGAITAVAFARMVPESLPATGKANRSGGSVWSMLTRAGRNRELAGVALALGLACCGFYAYITTTSFIVERQFGYAPVVFVLVFGTNALAVLGSTAVFRRLVRTRHPAQLVGIGHAVGAGSGAALLLCAALGAPAVALWAALAAFTASIGFVLPGSHGWGQLTLVVSGAASALTGFAQYLGGMIGSPVTGVIGPTAEHLGAVITISSGLALLAWAWARRSIASHPQGVSA